MNINKNCITFSLAALFSLSLFGCFHDNDNDDEPMKVNKPPVAMSFDVITQTEVAITDQLNGSDPDGDSLSFMLGDASTLGTVTIDASGSFTYQPFKEVTGSDSFTYSVKDSKGAQATATVGITIETLQVSFTEASRAAFAAGLGDEPLAVNGREFVNDVVNQSDYQDLIDNN